MAVAVASPSSGLLSAMRPKQWVKNLLATAVPLASGRLLEADVVAMTVLAFVVLCMASAAVYLTNDILDREADARHPRKRTRAIAAGVVPVPLAALTALGLATVAVLLPLLLGSAQLSLLVIGYLLLQAFYVFWAKHQPVLDLACVAAGFVLQIDAPDLALERHTSFSRHCSSQPYGTRLSESCFDLSYRMSALVRLSRPAARGYGCEQA